jgi:hypothetical protein
MLGLLLGFGTSLLLSTVSWRMSRELSDPDECRIIERCLKEAPDTQSELFRASRPGTLILEFVGVRRIPTHAVMLLNEALSEVDWATRRGLSTARLFARASFTAGIAGACTELALRIQTSPSQAVSWSLVALIGGIAGAVSCTVIGQRATLGIARRRRLWDEFIQGILNSQFRQPELSVPGGGYAPLVRVRNEGNS